MIDNHLKTRKMTNGIMDNLQKQSKKHVEIRAVKENAREMQEKMQKCKKYKNVIHSKMSY